MKNLRKKTIHGFAWNSAIIFIKRGLTVLIHVALARILVPEDFGIIGMLSIFTELSFRLQGAGLGDSLVRKKNVTQEEYNFVFYYGFFIGLICYLALYFMAPLIADFYAEPKLIWVTRVISLNLIIIPLTGINSIQLVKELNFKKLGIINLAATLLSGAIAITMAYHQYGVWSLVMQNVSLYFFSMVLLLVFARKLPTFSLDKKKSIRLFDFGSKLMVANFLQVGFNNIYTVIIGKQYTASDIGFYIQGMKLQKIPSNSINAIIKDVSFPAFAQIRDEKKRYREAFRKTLKLLTILNFPVLISLAVVADPLIPVLLSEKWMNTIPFFQMLVVVGLLEPIKSLFINILKIEGKGGRLIRYVIFTKIFHLLGIIISIRINIYALVLSQVLASFFELAVFSTIGKNIGYRLIDFLKDILPNLAMAMTIGGVILVFNRLDLFNDIPTLLIDLMIGITLFYVICSITRNSIFLEIKQEIYNLFR